MESIRKKIEINKVNAYSKYNFECIVVGKHVTSEITGNIS